jgi:hypothetical protein
VRRRDRIAMQFVAVHESLPGTFETCPPILRMSVHRARPEVAPAKSTRLTLSDLFRSAAK